ncbi:sulfite exporter TauE/SafE family protein [Erwinia sp. AnSW2-5]|uniref:sulfite exporter TauE/SafE family protein n=1 Tax=Erwinia sp. AnSW2-5 TaxID=3367692 RepID=UPI0038600523
MNIDISLVALGGFAFCGGLIDAAVGGGGLVQIPALIHALPDSSLSTIFGTNKLAVLLGNSFSVSGYLRRVKVKWQLIIPTMGAAFIFSFSGAYAVSLIPREFMEYLIFVILIIMAVYTFIKKDLGRIHSDIKIGSKEILLGIVLGAVIGFYDGIFGAGSGSLLLFAFVKYFGFDFLNASASAKLINIGTFTAALIFFVPSGHVLWVTGSIVGICNVAGAVTGVFLALRFGSGFIRFFFLILLLFLIGRMGISLL